MMLMMKTKMTATTTIATNLQECFSNAKYAVNMARKIGAPVYALPEDISEVNDHSTDDDNNAVNCYF